MHHRCKCGNVLFTVDVRESCVDCDHYYYDEDDEERICVISCDACFGEGCVLGTCLRCTQDVNFMMNWKD